MREPISAEQHDAGSTGRCAGPGIVAGLTVVPIRSAEHVTAAGTSDG